MNRLCATALLLAPPATAAAVNEQRQALTNTCGDWIYLPLPRPVNGLHNNKRSPQ
ncbi:hypothetical protein ACPESN_05350 [Stutzerimonas marianensis]|uniref:hypothetical protein n=1 Tax=Stutzerimonas marianensis TaxID=2929513 RepID=UPI003C2BB550